MAPEHPTRSAASRIRTWVGATASASFALAIVGVIGSSMLEFSRQPQFSLFQFLSYFTIQANLAAAVVLIGAAIARLRARPRRAWFELLHVSVVAQIIMVGVGYPLLVGPGIDTLEQPVHGLFLHFMTPAYVVLDWLLVTGRRPLPLRWLGWTMLYPILWMIGVLIHGRHGGWLPYEFLNPNGAPDLVLSRLLTLQAIVAAATTVLLLQTRRAEPVRESGAGVQLADGADVPNATTHESWR